MTYSVISSTLLLLCEVIEHLLLLVKKLLAGSDLLIMLHFRGFCVRKGCTGLLNCLLLLAQNVFIPAYSLLGLAELLELLLSHFIGQVN